VHNTSDLANIAAPLALQGCGKVESPICSAFCEIPAKPQWCEIRTTVFSWTPTRFPFHTGTAKKLTFGQSPIITVIGKAFWDVGHSPKHQGNRRKYMPDYAVLEIHPVMKMDVQ